MAVAKVQMESTENDMTVALRSEEHLSCNICFSQVEAPRCLPCLHTFCLGCLEKYIRHTTNARDLRGSHFNCPICRYPTVVPMSGVEGFIGNYVISSFKDVLKRTAMKIIDDAKDHNCSICKEDGESVCAVSKCNDCVDYLCDGCSSAHHKTRFTRHHKVQNLNDKEKGLVKIEYKCENHDDTIAERFCCVCKMLVCFMCQKTHHADHKCIETNLVKDFYRNEIFELLDKIDHNVTKHKDALTKVRGEINKIEISQGDLEGNVQKHVDCIQEEISSERSALLSVIKDAYRDPMHKLSDAENVLGSNISTLQKHLELSLKVIDDVFVDHQQTKNLIESLEEVHKSQDQLEEVGELPKVQEIVYFNFSDGKMLGKMMRTGTEYDIEEVYQFKTRVADDRKRSEVRDLTLSENGDVVYVTDVPNNAVKMFNSHGEFIDRFVDRSKSDTERPRSVNMFRNGDVVVGYECTENPRSLIKIFDSKGGYKGVMKTPAKGFSAAAQNSKSHVFVTDMSGKTVYICSLLGSPTGELTGGPPLASPFRVHIDKNDRVYISSVDDGLHVYDTAGTHLYSYRGDPRGGKFSPAGICVDQEGNVFITDYRCNCIHQLAPDGTFIKFLLTQYDGLMQPTAVALSPDNKLFVGQYDGIVKVYHYGKNLLPL